MSKVPAAVRHNLFAWLLMALAAALAAMPLLTNGYSCGHDFDFHLRSWMEVAAQWKAGIVKPVWSFHAGWNVGEPRLLFYPPLSWIMGAALSLLVPWSGIAFAYTALVFLLCGLSMRRLLRRWTSPSIALLGGCLYIVNPYMLFCAYERTAYAEFLAAAWMPLLLAALLRDRVTAWRVAVALGLLWLTNAPAGVIGCYTILTIAGIRLGLHLWKRDTIAWRYAGKVTAGVLLAFLLDGFYLVPFAMERKYITLSAALTPAASPDANFLFDHTTDEFHNGVMLHSSNTAIVLITLALLCGVTLLLLHRRVHSFHSMAARELAAQCHAHSRAVIAVLLLFSVAVLLLQLPLSAFIWHYAPELNFMQFPWRFLAMQGAVTTILVTLLVDHFVSGRRGRNAAAILTAVSLVLVGGMAYGFANTTFRQGCDDEEGLQPQWTAFHVGQGFEQTDEYTPTEDDNDALKINLPEAWIAPRYDDVPVQHDGTRTPGTLLAQQHHVHPDDLVIQPVAPTDGEFLIVRLRPFHGWHVLRDGVEFTGWQHRPDGLLSVPLGAAGPHRVEVLYRKSWDQWAGGALSLLALIGVFALARVESRGTERRTTVR